MTRQDAQQVAAERKPHEYPRRVLLLVAGWTPQVVTETVFALTQARTPRFVPTHVQVVTTRTGREQCEIALLRHGWFQRLREEWALPPMEFRTADLHVITNTRGEELEDIRTAADNAAAANAIASLIRNISADEDCALHVSLAGGRKTMGYFAGYALSLFGRGQDRLSHVLVDAPFESYKDFFFPTRGSCPIVRKVDGKEVWADCQNAHVDLAEIPFVRLRRGIPSALLLAEADYMTWVRRGSEAVRAPRLQVDFKNRRVVAGGFDLVRLEPTDRAVLAWLAWRGKTSAGPVRFHGARPLENYQDELARFLTLFATQRQDPGPRATYGEDFAPAVMRMRRSDINKVLRQTLDADSRHYEMQQTGARNRSQFELALPREAIELIGVPGARHFGSAARRKAA